MVKKAKKAIKKVAKKSCCCSKPTNKRVISERGLTDIYTAIVDKINSIMETYGEIKDVYHIVKQMAGNEEVSNLVKKIAGGDRDPQMFVLLAAAILQTLKTEMEDNDGIFDYTPPND